MRDVEGDARSGVRTIPVILGRTHTRYALSAINLLTFFGILILAIPEVPLAALLVLLAGIVYVQLYILLYRFIDLGHILCDLLIDGQFIGLGAMVYFIACMGLVP